MPEDLYQEVLEFARGLRIPVYGLDGELYPSLEEVEKADAEYRESRERMKEQAPSVRPAYDILESLWSKRRGTER